MKKILFLIIFGSFFTVNLMANDYARQINPTDTVKKGNYTIFSKSDKIGTMSFTKNKKSKEQVLTIKFGYPTPMPGNNSLTSTSVQSSRPFGDQGTTPEIKNVLILAGKYEDMTVLKDGARKNKYTLTGLTFPLHLKISSDTDIVEFELTEAGKWNIDIELKNN